MSRQVVFAPTVDIVTLLTKRFVPVCKFNAQKLQAALLACSDGCIAVVHDHDEVGRLQPGKPLPLILAAVAHRHKGVVTVELLVKKAEAESILNRFDTSAHKAHDSNSTVPQPDAPLQLEEAAEEAVACAAEADR